MITLLLILALLPPSLLCQFYGDIYGLSVGDRVAACNGDRCWAEGYVESCRGSHTYDLVCPADDLNTPERDGFVPGDSGYFLSWRGERLLGSWRGGRDYS